MLRDSLVCGCKHIPWCTAAVHLPCSIQQARIAAADLHFPRIWSSVVLMPLQHALQHRLIYKGGLKKASHKELFKSIIAGCLETPVTC